MEEEAKVRAATVRFYDALEGLMTGKGAAAMMAAWHHTPRVTSGHPIGEWSTGWDEISATWQEFAALGNPANAGTRIRDLKVFLYGDVAYTTCIFTASPSFGNAQMNVTNILHRVGGEWKLIHHHADRTPSVGAVFDQLAQDS